MLADGWYLDFAADDASFGGYVRLAGSSFWAAVVGLGRHPLVALRDDDVPRRPGLDVRTDGLWASLTCETPDEHWSVGMEAFATGYDDPAVALLDERGDVVALGFDLEWERSDALWSVHGDVLVGDERLRIDTRGAVAAEPRPPLTGRLDDGTPLTIDDVIPVVTEYGLLAGGVAADGDVRLQLDPRHAAPVKGVDGIPRALCAVTAADGRPGVAWVG
ncbi:MAG: hypothetical protein H0W70_01175 [Actinobacteria bacterium]|nr:hypothetical protein [Actinomycetota bacterium]